MHNPFWRNPYVLWKKSSLLVVQAVPKTVLPAYENGPLEDDFFHTAIAPVLRFAQLFGVFPLNSVMERVPEKLSFESTTLVCLISATAIFGGFSVSVLSIKRLGNGGINVINVAEPFFFGITATSTALFWQLAKRWKVLVDGWSRTEQIFLREPFEKILLRHRIRFVAIIVLSLAFVEHALSVGNNISNIRREVTVCNWTITNPVKHFCLKTFSTAFHTVPYNIPVAIYNEYIVISMTFAWNFIDLFVVLVSIGLSTRFNQLNRYISKHIRQRKPTSEQFWEKIRMHYVSLCELVETMNRSISRLVFVSYANDVYFICLQIMNAAHEQPFLINKIYFVYSFLFLILRAFLMFWYSTQVQHASHLPCRLILHVPNEEYCEELQRVEMYSKRGVSLTGMGVFLVSRKILLTIAGTIMTYELVLLAYRKRSDEESNSNTTVCEPLQLFIFSLVVIVVGLTMCYIEYERLERVGVSAKNIIGIIFYMDTVFIMMLMVNLSRKWHSVAIQWQYVDSVFLDNSERKSKPYLKSKIRYTAWILIGCGLFEHIISKTADLYGQYLEANYCHWDVHDLPRYFASRRYAFIFKHIPYNILIFLFFEYANTSLTMAWTCQDLMIILISQGLIFYFRKIHDQVQQFNSGIVIADEKFWIEVRSQYVLLCDLVSAVNDSLAPLIITSCGTNLYLICFQLLTVTERAPNIFARIDHWYALFYLILKTGIVFYSAAMINEAARAPLTVCTKVPNVGWCLELDRFTNQLRTDRVALSGMGFFHITKRTMLAMAGTVITYELVMLKFAEDTEGIGKVPPCSKLAFSKDA
ncbi:uncharacterized protein LOC131680771 [Topomyia yanbarensis]|uniref:uncharacterized protein LOC131680771 n=1 Tax=Topomyia yanbarensis TaxID=2498891 RepID=UPI00273A8031|nr:uncharacterized protein LOC131680771 [Topomyia yanbarensis]